MMHFRDKLANEISRMRKAKQRCCRCRGIHNVRIHYVLTDLHELCNRDRAMEHGLQQFGNLWVVALLTHCECRTPLHYWQDVSPYLLAPQWPPVCMGASGSHFLLS